jgi:hypothetical protein
MPFAATEMTAEAAFTADAGVDAFDAPDAAAGGAGGALNAPAAAIARNVTVICARAAGSLSTWRARRASSGVNETGGGFDGDVDGDVDADADADALADERLSGIPGAAPADTR